MTVQPNQAGNRYGVGKVGLGRLCRDRNCLYGRRVSTTQINMAADSTQVKFAISTDIYYLNLWLFCCIVKFNERLLYLLCILTHGKGLYWNRRCQYQYFLV